MSEPTPPLTLRHVFVYGTLRCGDVRDITRLHPAPQFVGVGNVAGVLHNLGAYPGVVLGGSGRVVGEVYAISPELERQLDAIEEVWPQETGEYSKQEVKVLLRQDLAPPGTVELLCLVYEVNPARTTGCPVIASGDWFEGRLRSS